MRDLPTGPTLLGLARDVLLNDILQLLPPESRLDARLVANSMAIAEREATAAEGVEQDIRQALDGLYAGAPLTHPAPTLVGAGSPLSRNAGEGATRSAAGEGDSDPLRRLARDLRAGAFGGSERPARDILWQLTVAKLRLANPRFLAANGFR